MWTKEEEDALKFMLTRVKAWPPSAGHQRIRWGVVKSNLNTMYNGKNCKMPFNLKLVMGRTNTMLYKKYLRMHAKYNKTTKPPRVIWDDLRNQLLIDLISTNKYTVLRNSIPTISWGKVSDAFEYRCSPDALRRHWSTIKPQSIELFCIDDANTSKDQGEKFTCSICLKANDRETMIMDTCDHEFHLKCIQECALRVKNVRIVAQIPKKTWLECPLCRKKSLITISSITLY